MQENEAVEGNALRVLGFGLSLRNSTFALNQGMNKDSEGGAVHAANLPWRDKRRPALAGCGCRWGC